MTQLVRLLAAILALLLVVVAGISAVTAVGTLLNLWGSHPDSPNETYLVTAALWGALAVICSVAAYRFWRSARSAAYRRTHDGESGSRPPARRSGA
jgi:hypothetical protein